MIKTMGNLFFVFFVAEKGVKTKKKIILRYKLNLVLFFLPFFYFILYIFFIGI